MILANRVTSILLLFGLVASGSAIAQKAAFSSVNQVGLLFGQTGTAFTAQTINGFRKYKWFAGAGVGLDVYQVKTIPVFADVRRDFSTGMNAPFAYGDLGINICPSIPNKNVFGTEQTTSPGLYYDLGVGWKLFLKNSRAIVVSAGYNYKQVKEKQRGITYLDDEATFERFNYSYHRIVLKLGLQL